MKCADPVLCYTPEKGTRQFRHFSLANPTFKALHQQVFNCGKCIFCRKKKSTELALRCVLHASLHPQNCFLTLTYDENKNGYNNDFDYTDIQKFKKRLRNLFRIPYSDLSTRKLKYYQTKTVQIFNVHEYGKKGKKHWHLVVFGHDFQDKTLFTVKNNNKLYTSKTLEKLWPFGFNTIGDVTEASAMYQAQYTQKDFKNGNVSNEKKSHSKHSGIGRDFFLKHYKQILQLGYVPVAGKKIPIPRYYQKLAHKHFSHFYQPENFRDTPERKKLYTPFKPGHANLEIADLYIQYSTQKQKHIAELEAEWETFIDENLFSKEIPDFRQAATNYLYDLDNKTTKQQF